MPDNNPIMRATIARLAQGIFNFQFTSTLMIGGVNIAHGACISQIDESDKLELAGRDILRALNISVLAEDLVGVNFTEGDAVNLDADPTWQIRKWVFSPDGAIYTFLLIDAD